MLKVPGERWNDLINCRRAYWHVDASDHSQGHEGLVNGTVSIEEGRDWAIIAIPMEAQPVVTTLIRY